MAQLIGGVEFVPANIKLDQTIYAAEQANKLVVEKGLSFRDAYLQVAKGLKKQ
jgi:argininosuccinate lyase